jgi:hypothetical protein
MWDAYSSLAPNPNSCMRRILSWPCFWLCFWEFWDWSMFVIFPFFLQLMNIVSIFLCPEVQKLEGRMGHIVFLLLNHVSFCHPPKTIT